MTAGWTEARRLRQLRRDPAGGAACRGDERRGDALVAGDHHPDRADTAVRKAKWRRDAAHVGGNDSNVDDRAHIAPVGLLVRNASSAGSKPRSTSSALVGVMPGSG